MVEDFDNDMSTSWRVILTSLDVVRVFPHQGKNSAVILFSHLPWFSRSFGVAELASAFLHFWDPNFNQFVLSTTLLI